ncbi:hypothetical protein PaecuDRAFT_3655 [Paenibacillus curdlanolyticus YK9]|uniref:Lipoprotein n=1 Tax=Paenibacillus curdlanolyticus YK9 TaxID=717606 RepID=E0IDF1_9BACL|nr:hypothetical protein [Paenibacillus curdlanolyticus]EFM09606.1 hypothetical protein PaecuDRAFT_3655 [Paenibacillus curdlanolyticus YK9]
MLRLRTYGVVLLACLTFMISACSSSENPATDPKESADKPTTQQTADDASVETGTPTSAKEQQQPEGSAPSITKPVVYQLEGLIDDKYAIEMKLAIEGSAATGSYFYTKYNQTIVLKGTARPDSEIGQIAVTLDELDESGQRTGRFSGTINSKDPSPTFAGNWSNADGTKAMPFVLSRKASSRVTRDEHTAPLAWSGTWNRLDNNQFESQSLAITELTDTTLKFDLDAQDGGRAGIIGGTAIRSKDGKTAMFSSTEANFKLIFKQQGEQLNVTTDGEDASYYGTVVFGGTFEKRDTTKNLDLIDLHVFSSAKINKSFKALVGNDYSLFTSSMQVVSSEPSVDEEHIHVISGDVMGLSGVEAIIMYDEDGSSFWAAVIEDEEHVNYYTNVRSDYNKLPAPIEKWRRERHKDDDVVFKN